MSGALPPNWTRHRDENSGFDYYYNTVTGMTQWTVPEWDHGPAQPHQPQQHFPQANGHTGPVSAEPWCYGDYQAQQCTGSRPLLQLIAQQPQPQQ